MTLETDAKVTGTPYHATGKVPCSIGHRRPMGYCAFGVTRQGKGKGLVVVTRPDGRQRTIYFDQGGAVRHDTSQPDAGVFKTSRQGDVTTVHIGEERYEIPDAVIDGG